jgi:histidinol-phosphate aminotransferase/imidazoleglycerol-phosphate dehydratase/histidinol-phosphatase
VPLRLETGWQLDVAAILAACKATTKLIFVPSPNAPMGHKMNRDDLVRLCEARATQGLVVVDEAYSEFSDQPEGLLPDLGRYPNLAILRTLSKAQALAGERIGAVIGQPALVQALQKIQAPYPLAQSSIRAAMEALSPNGLIQAAERRRLIRAERERLAALLPRSPHITRVLPSVANFLLLETGDAQAVMQRLRRFGILARNREPIVPGTVRVSMGTPEENDTLLRALEVAIPATRTACSPRLASARRVTKETAIDVTVNLDAPAFLNVETGIGFFDHMLAQLATHGGFGLALTCEGDLPVDQHHTIENCALTLGEAMKAALGDKAGLTRFGFVAPLDEALAQATLDLAGRAFATFEGALPSEKAGEMECAMVPHFFRSLATALGAAIHITVKGENAHHMIEACFKAVGRAFRQALRCEGDALPSTKGVL